jgi:hypothetical protein
MAGAGVSGGGEVGGSPDQHYRSLTRARPFDLALVRRC